MIHVFLGTKAQLIKTAPVLRRLDTEGVPYRLIDSGQHAAITADLRRELGIREPDAQMREGKSIETIAAGLWWLFKLLVWGTFRPADVRRRLFADQDGVCLIHGDTASTLVSLYLAKRAGLRVAHLEAGLRSYCIWNPFPEEIIRLIAMRGSDILFATSDWAYGNLERLGVKGNRVNLGINTGVEAVAAALARPSASEPLPRPYGLMTIHRLETIQRRDRLKAVVELALRAADGRSMVFVMHPATKRRLGRYGLLSQIERHPRIRVLPLIPHHEFLHLLRSAEFLITDGGSIQEESSYLGVPCMVLRERTERPDGLSENARLVPFDTTAAGEFLYEYRKYRRSPPVLSQQPSRKVVECLRRAA